MNHAYIHMNGRSLHLVKQRRINSIRQDAKQILMARPLIIISKETTFYIEDTTNFPGHSTKRTSFLSERAFSTSSCD